MVESEETAIEEFDTTVLVRINPKESTLPIDTSAEWTKGFSLINTLIKELSDHRYIEEFEDNSGVKRTRPMMHPQLLGYMQERRHMMDQIFKFMGGEVANELKKESAKKLADFLFKLQTDKIKEQYKKEAYKIIELEVSDGNAKSENRS
jgi:hypothetical protein